MIILASQSASRQAMLTAAGVAFTAVPAHLDERAIEAGMAGAPSGMVARGLAEAKALAVSHQNPGALVLGSDSLVEVAGRRFDKPASRDDAAAHLRFFSGKAMHLHSAAVLAKGGKTLWQDDVMAVLQVIEMSDAFIEKYDKINILH